MSTTYTPNYNLGKQTDHADKFDMAVITDNADKIDAALHDHDTELADLETGKQDTLTPAQLAAANSGATAEVLAADRAALVELVDNGGKNIFNPKTTISGDDTVTAVRNSDGTIALNTTSPTTRTAYIYLNDSPNFVVPAGTWVLSGVPEGYTGSQLALYNNGSWVAANGKEGQATFAESTNTRLIVRVASGVTLDNFTIKPMVCSKAAWDISQAYQPYRPSNAELYEMIQALQNGNSLSSVQSAAQLTSIDAGDNNADS